MNRKLQLRCTNSHVRLGQPFATQLMPEFPDLTVYVEALERQCLQRRISAIKLHSAFVLRTVDPPLQHVVGQSVTSIERLNKRLVFGFDNGLHLVLHLMIAGRLRWRHRDKKPPGGPKAHIAQITFDDGSLWLTEASAKKRASLHLVQGRDALAAFDRGGLEVFDADLNAFTTALTRRNRTLKRALTDPTILSGIGNAYSDEILFASRLSPVRLTQKLDAAENERLFDATRNVLTAYTDRLRNEVGDGFPEKVTAFRDDMAVHGRYRQPCLICSQPVQRIRYASNECNYCAECQNAGRLLADRGLSQLMRKDWPRTLEELEERRSGGPTPD